MEKAESFEQTSYGKEREEYDPRAVVTEIAGGSWGSGTARGLREAPSEAVRVSFVGDMLKVVYHAYEMHLPTRMKEVESNAKTTLDNAVKHLKSEFKKRTKDALDLKEKKDLANYTTQKFSLNERYYVTFWRFYELG